MPQGWYGNSEGHRRAGRLGGLKSAVSRRRKAAFRERLKQTGTPAEAGSESAHEDGGAANLNSSSTAAKHQTGQTGRLATQPAQPTAAASDGG
jgi:DNA-binding LacI/PurR family transcriptional regulator